MITPNVELELRIRAYANSNGRELIAFLGGGQDGDVWKSAQQTAIKGFHHHKNYCMELGCYQRLRSHGKRNIGQFAVPRLVDWDDYLWVVEVDIVTPPYLIDFGKAYLDNTAPDHSIETWEDHHEEQREIWGDKYGIVQAAVWELERMGIHYRDAKPKNISFGGPSE